MLTRPALWRMLFWLSLIVITYLALRPMSGGSMLFPFQDKVLHAAAYIYLYLCGWVAFAFMRSPWVLKLAIGLLIYGIAIEVLQGIGGYREAEFLDLAANISGIGLGVLAVSFYKRTIKIG